MPSKGIGTGATPNETTITNGAGKTRFAIVLAAVKLSVWTTGTGMLIVSKPNGGSAMSCGLELPVVKANVNAADWLPEVRLAAAVY